MYVYICREGNHVYLYYLPDTEKGGMICMFIWHGSHSVAKSAA